MAHIHDFGNQAETAACLWLQSQGFCIARRNFKALHGEIDIIASRDAMVCFIEVKARNHEYFPVSMVITPTKQKKIIATAQYFIAQHYHTEAVFRFDVIIALYNQGSWNFEHIENAFQPNNF